MNERPIICDGELEDVYELVDATQDVYYTIAIFKSIEDAKKCIESRDYPFGEAEDGQELELRKRKVGRVAWSNIGQIVLRAKIFEDCDEEKDKYFWTIEIAERGKSE